MKKMSKNVLFLILGVLIAFTIDVAAEAVINSGSVSYSNTTVSAALDELFSAVDINEKIGTQSIANIGDGTITGAINAVRGEKQSSYWTYWGNVIGTNNVLNLPSNYNEIIVEIYETAGGTGGIYTFHLAKNQLSSTHHYYAFGRYVTSTNYTGGNLVATNKGVYIGSYFSNGKDVSANSELKVFYR